MSTQIAALPDAPAATDPVEAFDAKAFTFNAALAAFRTQANALGQEMQINADVAAALILAMALPQFAGTSTSSVTVGTGARTFTTQAGKGWLPGQIVVASSGANYVKGTVTDYTGTDLQLNVTSINGSGTYAAWNIGLSYEGLALVSRGPITTSGLTQATARMLGRSTAGTGAVEEISLASTLELLAGVLGVKAASIGPAQLSGAQSGAAPVFGARAWFCADGTLTGTNAPLAGGNAVSVTRNSIGNFTFTWSTAVNINFAFSISGGDGNGRSWSEISRTTTSIRLVLSDASVAYDAALLSLVIFSQS